jgi:hypothetical protein
MRTFSFATMVAVALTLSSCGGSGVPDYTKIAGSYQGGGGWRSDTVPSSGSVNLNFDLNGQVTGWFSDSQGVTIYTIISDQSSFDGNHVALTLAPTSGIGRINLVGDMFLNAGIFTGTLIRNNQFHYTFDLRIPPP